MRKKAAANKRFGVMRGVCSQKVLREFESFVAHPSFCVPPPERQAANRWVSCGSHSSRSEIINYSHTEHKNNKQ